MTTDLFIRSYDGDAEWLRYCLRSIQRFATGFRRVVVVVPHGHTPPTGTSEIVFKVAEIGEQYIQQQSDKMHADHFTDAEFVVFLDSDCHLIRPMCPDDLIVDCRRPRWLYTPYASISSGDGLTWKKVTEKFIGHSVEFEFMRRHPFTAPAWALREMRAWCHKTHGVTLERYMMSQPDRQCSEFNFLGAYLWFYHRDKVVWQNTDEEMGEPFVQQHWSHGGIQDAMRKDMERVLA